MYPIRATTPSARRRIMPRSVARHRTCWSARSMQRRASIMTATSERAAPRLDPEEARRVRAERVENIGKWVLPILIMLLAIAAWDFICVWNEIPKYILPRPGVVLQTLYTDAGLLFSSLLVTLRITFLSLLLAVIG